MLRLNLLYGVFLSLILLVTLVNNGFAQAVSKEDLKPKEMPLRKKETKKDSNKDTKKKKTTVSPVLGESAQARNDSTLQILLMAGFIPRVAIGASFAFPIGSTLTVETFAEYGNYSFLGISNDRYRIGERFNVFVGNSFFLSAAFAYDAYDGTIENLFGIVPGKWEGKYDQLELEGGLGNQWQFDNGFTIGATWLGISQAVYKISQSSKVTSADESSSTGIVFENSGAENDETLRKMAQSFSLHFLKVNMGWAF